jgi:predicted CoA-binding protein
MAGMMNEEQLRQLLQEARTIAVVGHSDKPYRTSYAIADYLRSVGYTVYAVNPMIQEVDGQRAYADLASLPEPVDIVNVFRRAEHLRGVVDEAIAAKAKAVWGQLGVYDAEAGRVAERAGLKIVMDRCIKVDHRFLLHA